jgi:hypothetical protein
MTRILVSVSLFPSIKGEKNRGKGEKVRGQKTDRMRGSNIFLTLVSLAQRASVVKETGLWCLISKTREGLSFLENYAWHVSSRQ